jgi:hypothetical protein
MVSKASQIWQPDFTPFSMLIQFLWNSRSQILLVIFPRLQLMLFICPMTLWTPVRHQRLHWRHHFSADPQYISQLGWTQPQRFPVWRIHLIQISASVVDYKYVWSSWPNSDDSRGSSLGEIRLWNEVGSLGRSFSAAYRVLSPFNCIARQLTWK